MSYTINNTRGTVVTTVTPGTTQVVGGITLIGKNYGAVSYTHLRGHET